MDTKQTMTNEQRAEWHKCRVEAYRKAIADDAEHAEWLTELMHRHEAKVAQYTSRK